MQSRVFTTPAAPTKMLVTSPSSQLLQVTRTALLLLSGCWDCHLKQYLSTVPLSVTILRRHVSQRKWLWLESCGAAGRGANCMTIVASTFQPSGRVSRAYPGSSTHSCPSGFCQGKGSKRTSWNVLTLETWNSGTGSVTPDASECSCHLKTDLFHCLTVQPENNKRPLVRFIYWCQKWFSSNPFVETSCDDVTVFSYDGI